MNRMPRLEVLVVDDDPDLREILATLLRKRGNAVLATADANEALNYLGDSDRVGLVLLDLEMPIMTGCEFLARRQLDHQLRRVPVIVLSGLAGAAALVKPYNVEVVLEKPVAADVLLDLVAQYCGRDE